MACRLISQPGSRISPIGARTRPRRGATPNSDHLLAKVLSSNTGITSKFRKIGLFGDPYARVIRLTRRSKKRRAEFVAGYGAVGMTANCAVSEICRLGIRASSLSSTTVGSTAGAAEE